ncbi:hypothetical protein LQW54_010698 [Pestalotiopsis sp. IQ-011]
MDIFMPVASTYRPSVHKQRLTAAAAAAAAAEVSRDGNQAKTEEADRQPVGAPGRHGGLSATSGRTRTGPKSRSASRSRSKSKTRTRKRGIRRRTRQHGGVNESDSESTHGANSGQGRQPRGDMHEGDMATGDAGKARLVPAAATRDGALKSSSANLSDDDDWQSSAAPTNDKNSENINNHKEDDDPWEGQTKGRRTSPSAFSTHGPGEPSEPRAAVRPGGHHTTTLSPNLTPPVAPPAPFTTITAAAAAAAAANTTALPPLKTTSSSASSGGRQTNASQHIRQLFHNQHASTAAPSRHRAASFGAAPVANIDRHPVSGATVASALALAIAVGRRRDRDRDLPSSPAPVIADPATPSSGSASSARKNSAASSSRHTAHGSLSAVRTSDFQPLAATPSHSGAALATGPGAGAGAGIVPYRGAQRRHHSTHYAAMLSDSQSSLPTKPSPNNSNSAAFRRTGSVSSASVSGAPHLHRTGIMTSSDNLPPSSHEGSVSASNLSATSNLALKNRINVSPKPLVIRNGRTYIHDEQLPYPLPVDLAELHRQSLRTLLLFQLFGGPIISDAFATKPPQRILEVGCGSGFWSMMCHRYFAQHGHGGISFTGIDIVPLCGTGPDPNSKPDKDMNWRFVQHDMRRAPWPFQDGEFDLVMVKDMSCAAPGQFSQIFMDEYLRLLRPGGVLEIWETDMSMRMLRPHVPAPSATPAPAAAHPAPPPAAASTADDDSESASEDEDDATRLGVYIVSANTPLSAPLNQFLVEYNGWLSKALDRRFLSAVPCTMIGPMLLQEDGLIEVRSKRMAVPLSEVRWEREGVGGVVTKDGKSYIDSMKGKGKATDHRAGKGGKSLTAAQAAIRRTALETSVGLIQALEPMLRDVSGKSQDEWDGWTGKMMNDLLRDGGTSWGECLEIGAWSARRKS